MPWVEFSEETEPDPAVYRRLLSGRADPPLLLGLGVSALGDGMSTVSIAWLAVLLAHPAMSACLSGSP